MLQETVRAHVVFPRDVVDAIDRVAGRRRRSEFITEAVREKLTRSLQLKALEESFGVLAHGGDPEWETPERTSAWVRALREQADESTAAKLRRAQ